MALLPKNQRDQVMVLLIIVAVALIVVGAVMIVLNFRSRRLGGSGGTSTHEPGVL